MKNKVIVGVGSNSGNSLFNIKKAVSVLREDKRISQLKASALYETIPVGFNDQPNFINGAISFFSEYGLFEQLKMLKETEKKIGRIERFHWGPREIDLDLLFFGDTVFSDDLLTVPHKQILERDFVIVPAAEIEPDFIYPGKNVSLAEIETTIEKKNIVRKLN